MDNYMPYSGSHLPENSYVTPPADAGSDLHGAFPRREQTFAHSSSWFGPAPASSPYLPTISSSSSLAGALGHDASKPQPRPANAHVWPESEAFPIAPLTGGLHEHGASQVYASQDYAHYDAYADSCYGQDANAYSDTYDSSAFVTDVEGMEVEQGYLYGQVAPLATIVPPAPNSSFTSSSSFPARLALPPHPVPFVPTRSYTLEGAITPVESRKPRSPKIESPTTPASPSAPSASASDATGAASPPATPRSPAAPLALSAPAAVKHEPAPESLAPAAAPLPEPQSQAVLMTKFSMKPVFRPAPPPKPSKAPAADPDARAPAGDGAGSAAAAASTPGAAGPAPSKKKPAMACLFCRERKICCGPPAPESEDRRCKQCVKRDQACTFPTECRRGQHKRTPRKATIHALAAASFPDDDALAGIIVDTAEPPPVAGPSSGPAQTQPKATTQKVKAAKRGRKARVKPLEGISKVLDKPLVSSPTSLSPSTPTL
ncbi:Zn(II)2Cys6 transcription factor [Phanerochaete sordida]|uniref:Zn(II)2Cys6 transcription factor n=1 Tax=Phanerochaete sordida TaxID=48140 RepID=A0A9P3GBQ5_9APHY|nr:Zn(II)2Cys6 transcription factor [Phanerochaete sordida]